ncbi:MAG: Stearoyl-CoA 9-desaturase [Conexibacter sp.]|jgi:stearoyl-CoA desaturase (delta-9 desaturase)|nr:Stearoyl-CoA 9-desaturase [Conexibacter sp.]
MMTRVHRITNLLAVVLPFIAFIAAIALLWNRAVGPTDLAIMAVLYFSTAIGITVGYHRLFTHRAFETSTPVRVAFAILGSMAVEGSTITWVADHRRHHAFTDEEGDPHSPHVGRRPGVLGAIHGLYHAHVGWMLSGRHGRASAHRFAPDLVKDKPIRWVDRMFLYWVALTLTLPAVAGFVLSGFSLVGAATGLLWGGLVRIFMLHHVTWSINSVCHFFGSRRFDIDDESRNVFWLALPSLGEAWHHNHHAFPTSAFHGLKPIEKLADPTGLLIATMEKVGLVWNVVRVSPERQAQKAIVGV